MRRLLEYALLGFMNLVFWFRYKVTFKGVENLNSKTLNKSGGVLFLPNHPTVFVDSTLITMGVWLKYPTRPMVVEYMYYAPVANTILRFLRALPVPKFAISSNSLKKKRTEKVINTLIDGLRVKDNFLIYPSGKLKFTNKEMIGGASGVHQIISSVPEANIVLVRVTGLWGSRFSYALSDSPPDMFSIIFWGIKVCLKNLLFFTPRREVIVEYVPAGADFPYNGSRLEMNKYLENWFNKPEESSKAIEAYPGESLKLVPYSMWNNDLPTVDKGSVTKDEVDISKIPQEVQLKIKEKLASMANMKVENIHANLSLASDLGLDSLDAAEMVGFLADEFDLAGVPINQMTTVGQVMTIAAGQVVCQEEIEEEHKDLSIWNKQIEKKKVSIPAGATMIEVFLKNCDKFGNKAACADGRSGVLTYAQAKMRVILLADYIKTLPGEYIGILLPASVAAYLTILACQLAGKIPMPINWTVGPRHLESVASSSAVQVVLSSWSFIDRLENVDLDGVEEKIIMLEDVKREFSLKAKVRALFNSKRGTNAILRLFKADKLTQDTTAVLLYTSGTENMPKGVPLSHQNILSNLRGIIKIVDFFTDDSLVGILPPFHSFGFTVSGFLPLLAGIRVAYYANPTDGVGVAREIDKWRVSLFCGAPSFLKTIFKAAQPDQLTSLRLCVTGAEKPSSDLLELISRKLSHVEFKEGYGITECSPLLTFNPTGLPQYGVGKPIPDTELCIVSLDGHKELPLGERGLILARGPGIFSGYINPSINSPFLTVNGKQWYNTGDLGFIDNEGNLSLSGRLKRFIKIGGEMISLGSIEDALLQVAKKKGLIEQMDVPSLVICAKELNGDKPKIILVSNLFASLEEVNKSLKDSGFSNLVKVTQIEKINEIPLLGSGKVNYRELESRFLSN